MMDSIQILRKLVDEEAIAFIEKNKKDYDEQFKAFLDMHNKIG